MILPVVISMPGDPTAILLTESNHSRCLALCQAWDDIDGKNGANVKKENSDFCNSLRLRFTDGSRDFEFDAKLFLNHEGLIAGVGSRPGDNASYREVQLFDTSEEEDSFGLLAAALQFGLRHFSGRLRILPSHLEVNVSQESVHLLRGFEVPVFEQAGREAGASEVLVRRHGDR